MKSDEELKKEVHRLSNIERDVDVWDIAKLNYFKGQLKGRQEKTEEILKEIDELIEKQEFRGHLISASELEELKQKISHKK